MISIRCLGDNNHEISKYIFCSMSVLVIAASLILALTSLLIFISLYKYEFPSKNRKILILLMLTNLLICAFYICNEFLNLNNFEKIESFLRDCIFLICFYYFFQNMLYISNHRKNIFWILMSLILLLQIFSLFQLILRIFFDSICNLLFLQIKILTCTISILTFLYLANSWINSIINNCFSELSKSKKKNSKNSLTFINKNNLIKRLLQFKILLYVFFFAQIYNIIKTLFFYFLNQNYEKQNPQDKICLSLYGPEKEMIFYEYFDNEIEFFKIVEIGEYFFRIVFCFAIPIFVVFVILKSEYDFIKEASLASSSNCSNGKKNDSHNFIRGLNFQYDDEE